CFFFPSRGRHTSFSRDWSSDVCSSDLRTFDPGECLRLINDPSVGLTHFFGVPANYLFMSQHPDFATTDFSRLACSGVGGAPTPVPLLETYKARGRALQQGYGMTETSPTVFVQDAVMALSKPGS